MKQAESLIAKKGFKSKNWFIHVRFTPTYTHTHTHTHTHTYTHTHTHNGYVSTHKHTHTHTYIQYRSTHMHTYSTSAQTGVVACADTSYRGLWVIWVSVYAFINDFDWSIYFLTNQNR